MLTKTHETRTSLLLQIICALKVSVLPVLQKKTGCQLYLSGYTKTNQLSHHGELTTETQQGALVNPKGITR